MRIRLKDDDGNWTYAGDIVEFCYGIPPVKVQAEIIERDGQLIGLCPDHDPPEFNLRSLRRYVGNWYILKMPGFVNVRKRLLRMIEKYELEKDTRREDMAEPEYRLFEIDWSNNVPEVGEDRCQIWAAVGRRIDNYRIFSFTDNPDWCVGDVYDYQPCDNKGNRKYAIGRKEPTFTTGTLP